MYLIKATEKERLKNIKTLYKSAFPKSERKPFSMILSLLKKGVMEIFSIENESKHFCGLMILIFHKDIVLLDYLAVSENMRDKGIGSYALALLNEKYPDKRIILEIESTLRDTPDKDIRRRRLDFYLKNNMVVMEYEVDLFGVIMQILTNGKEILFSEYREIFETIFSYSVAKRVKKI